MELGHRQMFTVDRWREDSQAYFLTHLHSDHIAGLSSSWARGPLFCSSVSAQLLTCWFPGLDPSLIRILDVGKAHSIPLVSDTTGLEVSIEVIPLDAHHCPGAVMYLFRGEFGCVLHTGDFRWEPHSERAELAKDALLTALRSDKVDTLYVDNTYCNPSFSFPSRDAAAEQVVDIIKKHPDHDIIIGINKLGKEELLLNISKVLKTKIWFWPERLQTMHLLGLEDVSTADTSITRIRAIPCNTLTVASLEAANTVQPTIGIIASGLPWEFNCDTFEKRQEGCSRQLHPFLYSVLYSDHSCYNEIKEFVELVHPAIIKALVSSSSSCCISPHAYFGHICEGDIVSGNTSSSSECSRTDQTLGVARTNIVDQFKASKKEKLKMHLAVKSTYTSIRRSRVSLVRQKRRGAKLEETTSGTHTLGDT